MLVYIFICLPYQASIVDYKVNPVSFVLNLVAIFYVIGLDDLKEQDRNKPIELKRLHLEQVLNTDDDGDSEEYHVV